MAEFRHIDHGPFLGLNDDNNKLALRPGELQIASNVFHLGTTLHTRPGFLEEPDAVGGSAGFATDDIATAGVGSDSVNGIFEFRKDFDATRQLIVAAAGQFWKDYFTPTFLGLGGLTTTNPAAGVSTPWHFAQWRKLVFAAGGATADDAMMWDDPSGTPTAVQLVVEDSSGIAPSTNAQPSFTPKLVFEKWNYIFCAHFLNATGDGTNATTSSTISTDSNANPLIVRYCDLGAIDGTDIDTLAASFPYSNAIGGPGIGGLSGNWGDYITGFGEYTDNKGDWLIIGTNRRLYSVRQQVFGDRPFAITDEIPNGLVSQRAFVSLGVDSGDAIYMSSEGIHSLRQSQQHGAKANTFLSWPIRNTFNGLNRARLDQVSGAYWPTEGLVVFSVPNSTSTFNNFILALDIKNAGGEDLNSQNVRWYTWELAGTGHAAGTAEGVASFASARDSGDVPYIYAGTYTGDVLHGQTATYSDQGTTSASQVAYTIKWRTEDRSFDILGREKQLGDCYTKMTPVGNHKPSMTVYYDFGRRPVTRDVSLDAANVTSTWDVSVWDVDSWSSDFDVASGKQNYEGSGEVMAWEMEHAGANEPVGIVGLAYELATLGEDQGAR